MSLMKKEPSPAQIQANHANQPLRVLPFHQLLGALRGADHGFDQRHAQAAFFQFHQPIDGAAGGRGDHVLQLGRMLACVQD